MTTTEYDLHKDAIRKRDRYTMLGFQNTQGLSEDDRIKQSIEYHKAQKEWLEAEGKIR